MLNETRTIEKYWSRRVFMVALFFSVAFTIANVTGYYFFACNHPDQADFYSLETVVTNVITLIIAGFVSYVVFFFVCNHTFVHQEEGKKSLSKIVFFYSGLIFLCWTPYLVLRYPGVVQLDTIEQIIEFFYPEKTWYYYQVPDFENLSGPILLNHHPIMTTLLFSLFYKLGLLVGNASIGLFIYTIIQAACLAFVFGLSLAYLRKCGISRVLTTIFCLFFAVCPLNGLNATTIVKDNIFIIIMVLMQIGLVELLRNEEAFLRDRNKCVLFGILMLLLSLSRHNGLYICLVLTVIFFLAYRKRGRILEICSMVALVVVLLSNSLLFPALGVTKGSSIEALCVPIQQMGRYIHDHCDEISSEDREIIEASLKPGVSLEAVADGYQPYRADGVKDLVKTDISSDQKLSLGRLWIKWFSDDEKCYVKATLNMIYPAFKTSSGGKKEPDGTIITTKQIDEENHDEVIVSVFHTESDIGINREKMKFFHLSKTIDIAIIDKLMETWGIRVLFQMDFYVWMMLAVFSVLIIKKQYKNIIVMSVVGINFLITLLGPIMYMRYFYPITCCLPLMISHALTLDWKGKR